MPELRGYWKGEQREVHSVRRRGLDLCPPGTPVSGIMINLDAPQCVIGTYGRPLSDLIGDGVRLVIYRDGAELREVDGVIVQPGQTIRQAIKLQLGPGEEVRLVPSR